MKPDFSQTNFNAISEIHPLAPLFTYEIAKRNGYLHYIKLFTYDHLKKEIVDISHLTAHETGRRITKGAVSLSGAGMNMHQFLIDDFKMKYKQVTDGDFLGQSYRHKKGEESWLNEDIEKFMSLKENQLKYATPTDKNSANFVYESVKKCGCAIQYANPRLKNNKKIAIAAILDDYSALRYLGDKIKDNGEIVLLAVNQFENAYLWASSRLIQAIGTQSPKKALESMILNKELNVSLEEKEFSKKIKI